MFTQFDRDRLETQAAALGITISERTLELENAVKELEAFTYSVAHDLRAPLRAINSFSQILIEDFADRFAGAPLDYLERISRASQRMSQLIDDLLNLSRIGRGDVQRLNVDLSALVAEIAARLSEASGRRDIRLEVEDGVNTVGDPRLLAIALENLLNNAFKFSRHRQIPVIRFYTTTRDGQTVFYVSDNGAGFDMRYQHKLFAPFQRLHLDDEFEGTGIGLVTVARIVDRHAGKVWIEGSQDQGATVSVFIPSTSTL